MFVTGEGDVPCHFRDFLDSFATCYVPLVEGRGFIEPLLPDFSCVIFTVSDHTRMPYTLVPNSRHGGGIRLRRRTRLAHPADKASLVINLGGL
jgi:hypothetical protein